MLYLVKRKDRAGYDHAMGFVIRATSARKARAIAADNAGDEGRDTWLDPSKTICTGLRGEGDNVVILKDFRAG